MRTEGGSGLLQMFDTKSRTMAIDIYLPFEHAGFVYKSNFRFRLLWQNEQAINLTIGYARRISVRQYIRALQIW